ncbi:hypothetical protein L1S32_09435 [Methanogenium sp. S4BF]|uniref:DUF7524 family protein n=1 Tax=Methanogenium sp. S4BF TaxID=1789226 RepID=UPI002416C189|nr:hypothetical protein [Methanogenium sp. S4BF]WFN34063.1 hypothetical protein L1S32_09435 [Methanogenium sp. S4BF]
MTGICEIHLNRRQINAVDIPQKTIVEPGTDLVVRFVNHGSPIHLTLKAINASSFTDFFHANIYVPDTEDFIIPIREYAPSGDFSLEVIVGYGTKRAETPIEVLRPEVEERFTESPDLPDPDDGRRGANPLSAGGILPVALTIGLSLLLYSLWFMEGETVYNYIAYVLLFLGVIAAWFSNR